MSDLILPKAKKKPFETLADYIDAKAGRSNSKGVEFPCPECCGEGKIWDPYGRDSYEGNKMNTKVPCPFCHATGMAEKDYWQSRYNTDLIEWRKEREYHKMITDLQKSAASKLTPEELYSLTSGEGAKFNNQEVIENFRVLWVKIRDKKLTSIGSYPKKD